MTITLSAEQERLIAEAMQVGGYEKADDLIARALEVLRAGAAIRMSFKA